MTEDQKKEVEFTEELIGVIEKHDADMYGVVKVLTMLSGGSLFVVRKKQKEDDASVIHPAGFVFGSTSFVERVSDLLCKEGATVMEGEGEEGGDA